MHETIRVKSAEFDYNSFLIYTTLNHIKYCLPNGDSGIIRTLDVPVYIAKVFGNIIYCLDRDGKNRQIQVRIEHGGSVTVVQATQCCSGELCRSGLMHEGASLSYWRSNPRLTWCHTNCCSLSSYRVTTSLWTA